MKRYSQRKSWNDCILVENPEGEWVRFDDIKLTEDDRATLQSLRNLAYATMIGCTEGRALHTLSKAQVELLDRLMRDLS